MIVLDELSILNIGKAIAIRKEVCEVFYKYFKDFDILITPTTPIPAFKIEMGKRGTIFPIIKGKSLNITSWMSYTYPFNMTGLPAAKYSHSFKGLTAWIASLTANGMISTL